MFIDNLLVRIHFIIVMIRWTGLAPWEFEFPFPGSLTSTFLVGHVFKAHRLLYTSLTSAESLVMSGRVPELWSTGAGAFSHRFPLF